MKKFTSFCIVALGVLMIAIAYYQFGVQQGKKQIINQIGLATYNQVKNPIWIDTIWSKNTIHFDTVLTYIITKGKENGEDNSYSVTLPEGSGYDFLTLQQTDSVLQGYEIH